MKCKKCELDYLDNEPENHTSLKNDINITLVIWDCNRCKNRNIVEYMKDEEK